MLPADAMTALRRRNSCHSMTSGSDIDRCRRRAVGRMAGRVRAARQACQHGRAEMA